MIVCKIEISSHIAEKVFYFANCVLCVDVCTIVFSTGKEGLFLQQNQLQ